MKDSPRNSNIELLRIVSMFMVLTLHYFNFGKALSQSTAGTAAYCLVWTLEAVCLIGVNCFMLISGYFLSQKRFTSRRILSFYAQILFYAVVMTAFCVFSGIADLTVWNLIQAIPVMSGNNWYVTIYFCVLFLTPALNHLVHTMDRKLLRTVLIAQFVLFSVLHTVFFYTDTFRMAGGHSICWYCFVYMVGAYYRKYEIRVSRKQYVLLLLILLPPLSRFLSDSVHRTALKYLVQVLYGYDAFPVLIASLIFFDFFVGITIHSERANRVIRLFGKTSFAVFYIHAFILLGDRLWIALGCGKYIDSGWQLLHLTVCNIAIYLVCSAFELLRLRLFKALKIDDAISALSEKIDAGISG